MIEERQKGVLQNRVVVSTFSWFCRGRK